MSRLTTRQGLTPWDVAALRYAGSFLAVLPLLAWHGVPRIALRRVPAIVVFAGLCFPVLAYAGYQFAPAAHGAVLMAACLPVLAALLGMAMGQGRIGPRRAASLGTVVAGCLLLGIATSGVYAGAWRGDLLFLVAACSWSLYTVLVQRWRLPAIDTTIVVGLCTAPVYLPVWWLFLPSGMAEAPWSVILTQGVFHGVWAGTIASILYTQAVASIGPGPTTMIGAVVPGIAAMIAWPLLGEVLPPLGIGAVAVVLAGTLLGVLRPDRRG